MVQSGVAMLIEGNDPLFIDQRKHIVALTNSHKIPTIFFERGAVVDGGLMGYSAEFSDSSARSAPMSAASSKARSPLTCRCCSRPSSNW